MLDIRTVYRGETKPGLADIKRGRNIVVLKIHAKTGTFGLHFCIAWENLQTMPDLAWEPWRPADEISRATRAWHASMC